MCSARIFPPLTSSSFSFERKKTPQITDEDVSPAEAVKSSVVVTEECEAAITIPAGPDAGEKDPMPQPAKVSDADAENAVRTLLNWLGDDSERESLKETPARVVRGWKEFFKGYKEDPKQHLSKTFPNTEKYDDMVCLENIRLESYCEHHLVPITGTAFIAYIPGERIVGLSKLARVMEGYARRLQIQEKLTHQIASAMNEMLKPKGVAVAIRSEHQCLSTRGVHKPGSEMLTVTTFGLFQNDSRRRAEFMALVNRR